MVRCWTGRDIGTVIFPDADVKLFVTASVETRAERRWREHEAASLETVTADLRARDALDAARAAAPLRPAVDATVLDTTGMDPDEAFAAAMAAIRALPLPLGRAIAYGDPSVENSLPLAGEGRVRVADQPGDRCKD